MPNWLIPREDLTPDQQRAVALDPREHRVIVGAPGSGKTQVLVHRACYLRDHCHIAPERLQLFVFTQVLKTYVQAALNLLGWPEGCVSTLDAWCYRYYRIHIRRRLPKQRGVVDFPALSQAVLAHVRQTVSAPLYDCVLVDEGQDLDSVAYELLQVLARHLTICLDPRQQLYARGLSEAAILHTFGLRHHHTTLLDTFRCCPSVVTVAGQFLETPEDCAAFVRQAKTFQATRETPLLYYAADLDDEKQRLLAMVRTRLARNETLAVLLPTQQQVYGFATVLRDSGITDVETPDTLDFTSAAPKVLTYHSAKGLTFDTVLLPRLVPRSFRHIQEGSVSRMMFVGISRATTWIYLSTQHQQPLPVLVRLQPLVAQGLLTIQCSVACAQPACDPDLAEKRDRPTLLRALVVCLQQIGERRVRGTVEGGR